ncbi:MAG: DNA-binding protein [Nitrospinae bacterium RIFCSPLOWO2_12_FULL_45_22]|nr:MAG: DNA-binding protein [Nitrospinae bacterium RIFCSPLOWO2_12_FULL_45_22]
MTESTLTIKELAKYLNVTERTIYNLLERGQLPGFKVGGAWRFKREDINNWIEDNKKMNHKIKTKKRQKIQNRK